MANSGNTFLALLTGAAIGTVVGLLYAPEKGEVTRNKLTKEAKKARSTFDKQLEETTDQLSDSAKKAKLNFEKKLEETLSTASYKADSIIDRLEEKLEELKSKNSKLQRNVKKEEVKTKSKEATA